jgi:hypothetical protein
MLKEEKIKKNNLEYYILHKILFEFINFKIGVCHFSIKKYIIEI